MRIKNEFISKRHFISLFKGFMFSASLLVCCFLLQRNLATTEGHHGTNCHVFYAIQMKGGTKAVRALAEQYGLEFIQRVSACLKLLLCPQHMGLQSWGFFFPSSSSFFFKSCQSADFYFLLEGYLTFIKLQQHFRIFHI